MYGAKSAKLRASLAVVRVLSAYVRDQKYEIRGVPVTGSKHFAPGSEVYLHGAFSGDGYERVLVTARHRDTGRFETVMMPVKRFERFRVVYVTHVILLQRMAERPGRPWSSLSEEELEAHAALLNARWPPG